MISFLFQRLATIVPTLLFVTVLVPAKITENRIEFTLPDSNGYTGRFVGVFAEDALIGSFEPAQINRVTDTWEFRLRRTTSYWQAAD